MDGEAAGGALVVVVCVCVCVGWGDGGGGSLFKRRVLIGVASARCGWGPWSASL